MSKNTNLSFLTDYITADITNGRIGINNASPTVAFDVVGATKITGVLTLTSTISNGTYAYTLPSATGTLALTSALSGTTNYVAKFTSSTGIGNSLIYDDGTNVGIGTTAPNQLVSIRKTSSGAETVALSLQNAAGAPGTATALVFSPHETLPNIEPLAKISAIRMVTVNAITDLAFYTYGIGGLTEKTRITSTGNILVNTSTNNNVGNDGNKGITINSGGAGLASFISFRTSNADRGIMYANDSEMLIGTQTSIPLRLYTNNTERITITSGGRVLISGDVWGTERFGVVLDSTLTASTGITAYMNSGSYTGSLIRVQAETTGSTGWYGYELRALGVIKYGIYGNGAVTAPSDERRKKNIETTRDGYLQDVCNLRVVKYNWKDDEEGKNRELGFIAQEVEKIFPKLVETGHDGLNNENEVKLLKQGVFVPILVKAIQELKAEIETLKQINL